MLSWLVMLSAPTVPVAGDHCGVWGSLMMMLSWLVMQPAPTVPAPALAPAPAAAPTHVSALGGGVCARALWGAELSCVGGVWCCDEQLKWRRW